MEFAIRIEVQFLKIATTGEVWAVLDKFQQVLIVTHIYAQLLAIVETWVGEAGTWAQALRETGVKDDFGRLEHAANRVQVTVQVLLWERNSTGPETLIIIEHEDAIHFLDSKGLSL